MPEEVPGAHLHIIYARGEAPAYTKVLKAGVTAKPRPYFLQVFPSAMVKLPHAFMQNPPGNVARFPYLCNEKKTEYQPT